ncbi:TonB family protein [Myxococcus sp. RHSTA-1-4]|uniref:TonB family protein n=1 Tax=Myxococcus sp. RHSTA-1-4 TaxID=2874601 RepID=UPI001CC15E6E|nr:TonB family protein [Myxococcus sp. RHSTA-1-4]MBZ4421462.1 TonB family protein [Myxococcus sp. RHSTA-1-4]
MAAAKNNGLTLRITGPDGSTVEAVSEAESVIVGSGAQAAVKIQDPRVSNLHVMLKVDKDGSVTAIDLGSESGTEVHGQRMLIPTALKPGDVLKVGGTKVEVLFGATEPARHAPAGAKVAGPAFQGSVTQRAPVTEVVTPPSALPPPRVPVPMAPVSGNRVEASVSGVSVRTERPAAPVMPPVEPPGMNKVPRPRAVTPSRPAHLQEPLPPEAMPTPEAKLLQVAMHWGDQLLEVQHFKDGVPVTIGEGKKNFFHVYTPSVGERYVLAVSHRDKLEVRAPAGAGLIVTNQGDVRSKDALRAAGALGAQDKEQVLTLGLHDRVEVTLGTVSFVVRYVRPSPAIAANALVDADYTFFKIASICLMAGLAVILAMVLTPRAELPESADIFEDQQRVAKFLITPEKKLEQKKLQLTGVEEGAKAKDEEGKFGKEEAKQQEAAPSKPGTPVVDKNKKEKDRQVVGKVGLLGAFKGLKGGASDVFGPGGFGTGLNNALGGLKGGAAMGDAQGVGGLGSRGTGTGGGGTALGIGGLGTQGTGRGAGGSGGIDLGGRGKSITKVIPGKTTVVGGLDKDVIAKVIRRHQGEIKYCYESELNKNPSLAGKVAVAFTIDPTGAVSDATVSESTLNNAKAEQCMLSRIRRWKFPEPKGGGVVAVTYPWLFSPAGGEGGEG